MKSHVWRPLYLVLGIVVLVLIARLFIVPKGFGMHEQGYMYGFYRKANVDGMEGRRGKIQNRGVLQGLSRGEDSQAQRFPARRYSRAKTVMVPPVIIREIRRNWKLTGAGSFACAVMPICPMRRAAGQK